MNGHLPYLNGKTLSYEMLYNVIGQRFHECLLKQSESQPDIAEKLSDRELVHSVCRKERLTFYNFLMEHSYDNVSYHEESIKEMLNREYGVYFRKSDQPPDRVRKLDIYQKSGLVSSTNTLNDKFSVEFN